MTDSKTMQAAELLMRARQGGARIAGLGDAAPQDEAAAFAIQREVLRRLGASIGGYKCAAPPGKPAAAAIMADTGLRPSPARREVPAREQLGIETEIAFRFGRDLPAPAPPYSLEEVQDAVAGCFPAVELVGSRYRDSKAVGPLEAMADCIAHVGFIMGADVPNWRNLDLKNLVVRQSYGDTVQVEKQGGNPSGDPLVALLWLVNWLPSVGLHLEAGQVVTTGSCTGLLFVKPGQRVVGALDGFGEAAVDLA